MATEQLGTRIFSTLFIVWASNEHMAVNIVTTSRDKLFGTWKELKNLQQIKYLVQHHKYRLTDEKLIALTQLQI